MNASKDLILKLLLLGGRNNPNPHERELARTKAEALMVRHGLTLTDMRAYYRKQAGNSEPVSKKRFRNYGRPMTSAEVFQLLVELVEEEIRKRRQP